MSLVSSTALLVASLDLQLTRSVIGAIRAADQQSAKELGSSRDRSSGQIDPQPRFNPRSTAAPFVADRVVIHPEAKYLPRQMIHPAPMATAGAPSPLEHPHHVEPTFQPPRKTLPYPQKIYAHPKIKHAAHQPDIPHKGTMIDFFC